MAVPFADEAYYVANFGQVPATIADRLDAELARASRYVRRECPGVDERLVLPSTDPRWLDPDVAADVVCEMVKAASATPGGVGVDSVQAGAGPFQQTFRYSNPSGDLYLSKKQKRLLGCGGQAAFTVSMLPEAT